MGIPERAMARADLAMENLIEHLAEAFWLQFQKEAGQPGRAWADVPSHSKGVYRVRAHSACEALNLAGMVPVVINVEPSGTVEGKEFTPRGWAAMLTTDFLVGKAIGTDPAAKQAARVALWGRVLAKWVIVPADAAEALAAARVEVGSGG